MPNGWGQQKLYDLKIEYQEIGADGTPVIVEEKIGFRTVELIEDDLPSIYCVLHSGHRRSFAYIIIHQSVGPTISA